MNQLTEPLFDKAQTAQRIKAIVDEYAGDLEKCLIVRNGRNVPLSALPLKEFFDFVREIPYRRDKKPIEIVSRPYYIVKHLSLGYDCKKKAVLMASYCKLNSIPFRFIGSSQRKDGKIHHIFVQGLFNGQWLNLDATYPDYKLFESKEITNAEVL